MSRRISFLPLLTIILAAASPQAVWSSTPVILSTDIGNEIDDQWAVAYMLTNPAFDVKGIVSAQAPTLPDPSAHYTYQVLVNVVERRLGFAVHPPFFEGASQPLPNRSTPRRNSGVDFIIEASRSYGKDRRLTLLTIGAATDVASAILVDPSICDRVTVVAMGFKNLAAGGGKEFNVENDPGAWQAILESRVPVVIGSGDTCQAFLGLGFEQAKEMLAGHGEIGEWLWAEYQGWYFRSVKPLRVHNLSKPWIIWDIITLAYLEGMTSQKQIPRLSLADDLSFGKPDGSRSIEWITAVDSKRLWANFLTDIDFHQRTHKIEPYTGPN